MHHVLAVAKVTHSIKGTVFEQERTVSERCPPAQESTSAELVDEVLSGSYQQRVPGTGDMRHGTEGWHALETSCKVLRLLVG